ncbi:MAG: hypothetical protein QNJ98_19385 [Planctomycetota bacterium]|nr:hypothetical protein [Planctomycetota bacterium]
MGRQRKQRIRWRFAARVVEETQVALMLGTIRILAALPSRWVLRFADGAAWLLFHLDRRGREAARQNLRVAFGEDLPKERARTITRASYRESVRSILLLLHLQPLTEAKWRRWVDIPDDVESDPRVKQMRETGAILVSGHVGNWELLLGMRVAFQDLPPTVFVAEAIPNNAVNRVVEQLRSHGDLVGAMRKGGARLVTNTVRNGGIAAILADRNVRGVHGGVYVPFLGLPARTTPLPAWLALRNEVPLFPVLCLPIENDRYFVWVGPDLTQDLGTDDPNHQLYEVTRRVNHVLSQVIRARPEIWNWTLKRFKGRPETDLGEYPAYSRYDPDSEARKRRY